MYLAAETSILTEALERLGKALDEYSHA